MPTVSIIVPAYNASTYLRECVDSVLGQDFLDWELILIDDGSTDDTAKICEEYASMENISFVSQSNQGVSVARNKGLELATGVFVMFIDADDILPSHSLRTFYRAYLDNLHADIIRGEYEAIDRNGNMIFTSNKKVFNKSRFYCEDDINRFYLKYIRNECFLWLMWIRRSCMEDALFTEGHIYMEDAEFLFKLFPNVQRCIYVPHVIYKYRKYDDAASSSLNDKKLNDITSFAMQLAAESDYTKKLPAKVLSYTINNCWEIVFRYLLALDETARHQLIENHSLRSKAKSCLTEGSGSSDLNCFVTQPTETFVTKFLKRQKQRRLLSAFVKALSYLKARF